MRIACGRLKTVACFSDGLCRHPERQIDEPRGSIANRYGKVQALNGVSLAILRGVTVGLIGPQRRGQVPLLPLMAGVRIIQDGTVEVLGGNMADKKRGGICRTSSPICRSGA